MWHLIQTNLEISTGKWKLALSHTHSRNTKHRGWPWISKEWGPYQVETQGNIFNNIYSQLNTSRKIDLFATRLNTQLSTFVSYRPDPKCIVVNAFLLDWSKLDFYPSPPFVCLNRVLQKIYQDKTKGIVIAPDWPSQPFYPRLITMPIQTISIAPRETNLYLPNQPAVKHPLGKTLKIRACLVDGTRII